MPPYTLAAISKSQVALVLIIALRQYLIPAPLFSCPVLFSTYSHHLLFFPLLHTYANIPGNRHKHFSYAKIYRRSLAIILNVSESHLWHHTKNIKPTGSQSTTVFQRLSHVATRWLNKLKPDGFDWFSALWVGITLQTLYSIFLILSV